MHFYLFFRRGQYTFTLGLHFCRLSLYIFTGATIPIDMYSGVLSLRILKVLPEVLEGNL